MVTPRGLSAIACVTSLRRLARGVDTWAMRYIAYPASLNGGVWRPLALLCLAAAALGGCGPPQGKGVPEPPPPIPEELGRHAPQAVSPLGAEARGDQPVDGMNPAAEGSGEFLLTEAILDRVTRGMVPAEVDAAVGHGGVAAGGDGGAVQVLRWTDADGNSFTARFDEGKLRTRSRLRLAQPAGAAQRGGDEPEMAAGTPAPRELDGQPVAEIAPGVYVPLERAVASSNSQPMGVRPPEGKGPDAGRPIQWVAPAKE